MSRPPSSFTRPAGQSAAFTAVDWALLTAVASMWGFSFLFIDLAVEHLRPELVALLRVAFGTATLAAIPAARREILRSDWPAIALLGAVWMPVTFVLFPVAEQWIDSSLAGMLSAATPLFTALGAALVLLATLLHGIVFNLAAPLQQRHGALPVLWRAQIVALLLLAPPGLASVPASSFAWSSLLAVAALGSLGTALAFAAFTTLVGRVVPIRASVSLYFLPVVAIALGGLLRDEAITAAAVLGTGLVAAGAYLTSRRERRTPRTTSQRSPRPTGIDRPPPPPRLRSAGGAHQIAKR